MTQDLYAVRECPVVLVISGPSGVGKDTVARRLLERRPQEFHFVVTATSRPPRPGEVDGRDYVFVSDDEFKRMIREGEMLEHAVVYGQFKGIPKQQVRDALNSGKNVLLRIDVQGAATVRALMPEALTVFIRTLTDEDLVRRLTRRKADSAEALRRRITAAQQEMKRVEEFDYCVVNAEGRQEEAVERILCIVDAARSRVHQKPITI